MTIARNGFASNGSNFFDNMGINVSNIQGENKGARGIDPQLGESENLLNNMPLVESILAKKHIHPSNRGYEDAKQNALIALLKAIRGYNPTMGCFSTYATPAIQRAIIRGINYESMIVVPPHAYKEYGNSKNFGGIVDNDGKDQSEAIPDYRGVKNVDWDDAVETLKSRVSALEFDCWDRSKKDIEISKIHGLTRQRIGQIRQKYAQDVQKVYEQITS